MRTETLLNAIEKCCLFTNKNANVRNRQIKAFRAAILARDAAYRARLDGYEEIMIDADIEVSRLKAQITELEHFEDKWRHYSQDLDEVIEKQKQRIAELEARIEALGREP